MVSKRGSRSEAGNTEPKARWRDKIRGKHEDTSTVEADLQPSACEEGSKVGLVTLMPCLIIILSYNSTDPLVLFKAADIDTSPTRKQ